MLVQTCTERKPASVVTHRAGKWWNYALVPPIVYTGFAPVSNSSCPVFIASRAPSFAILASFSYPPFLVSHID